MNKATAIILCSGPSLTADQVEAVRLAGYTTIAVNSTFRVAPWATMLYAADYLWLKTNMADIERSFKGLLFTQESAAAARWPQIRYIRGANKEGLGTTRIHPNGNSGVGAINLAFIMGYRKIVLLGFDMQAGPNGEKHHHPDHPHPLPQSLLFEEWKFKLPKVAADLEREGCDVVNCSPRASDRCFRRSNLENEL